MIAKAATRKGRRVEGLPFWKVRRKADEGLEELRGLGASVFLRFASAFFSSLSVTSSSLTAWLRPSPEAQVLRLP